MNPLIVELNAGNFKTLVLEASQPVVVAFSAPWSRPCQIIQAALEEVATACAQKAVVAHVNVDNHPDFGVWYEIQSVPTLLCFVQGKVRARIVGTATSGAILAKLKPFLPEP